jgi:hypothetical protein
MTQEQKIIRAPSPPLPLRAFDAAKPNRCALHSVWIALGAEKNRLVIQRFVQILEPRCAYPVR